MSHEVVYEWYEKREMLYQAKEIFVRLSKKCILTQFCLHLNSCFCGIHTSRWWHCV